MRLGGTEVPSPVKHSARATNLWIVNTVSELPAATVTHGGGYRELANRPAIIEFGRYGLDGWVVAGWVGVPDLGVTCRDGVPDAEVTCWVWLGDPGVAAESGALVESDGAG
jgi:hypothetical protein